MPALQWLGRRWRSASDDYVFSSVAYAVFCVAAGVLAVSQVHRADVVVPGGASQRRLVIRRCEQAPARLPRSLLGLGCVDVAAAVVLLLLAVCSSRGALFEQSRRWPVPYLLTVVLLAVVAALVLCALCTHAALSSAHAWHCSAAAAVHLLRGVVALNFLACCAYLLSLVLSYDPLGHTAHMTQDEYAQTWWRRLRLLCCQCWKEHHDEDAYKDVAAVFASALRGYDMVLSDIVAGMLLLHGYQQCSQRVLARHVRYPPPSTPHTTEVVSTQARVLRRLSEEQRRVVHDLHRYARFYMAAYGWKLRVYRDCCRALPQLLHDECTASCATMAKYVCCCCCYGGGGGSSDRDGDDDDGPGNGVTQTISNNNNNNTAAAAIVCRHGGVCAHGPQRRRTTVAATSSPCERSPRTDTDNSEDGDAAAAAASPSHHNNNNNNSNGSSSQHARFPAHRSSGSNSHRLDLAALLHETGVSREDVLVASWSNRVFAPVYYAVYDRSSDAVVICIRGTMSLADCITDFVTTTATVELKDAAAMHRTRAASASHTSSNSGGDGDRTCNDDQAARAHGGDDDDDDATASPYYVHGGMYRSACYVLRSLTYHGVVHRITTGVYARARVVVLGHSLGAGVAMVLAALLRSTYAVLRDRLSCLAYAPPGAVLSRALMDYCDSFTVGCFLGYDMVPRMAPHTFDAFRESLFDVMAASHVSKARLLLNFFRTEEVARPLHPCSRTTVSACHVATATAATAPSSSSWPVQQQQQQQRCRRRRRGTMSSESAAYRAALRQHACVPTRASPELYSCKTLVHFRKAVQRTRRRVPWLRGSRGFVVAGGSDDGDSRCCFCCGSCVCGGCTAHELVYVPCFVDADELQTLLVAPTMFHDHFPDKLYTALQRAHAGLSDGSLERFYIDDEPPYVDAREAPLSYVPLSDLDDGDDEDEDEVRHGHAVAVTVVAAAAATTTATRAPPRPCTSVEPVSSLADDASATTTMSARRRSMVAAAATTTTTATAAASTLAAQRVASYGTVASDSTSPSSDLDLLHHAR